MRNRTYQRNGAGGNELTQVSVTANREYKSTVFSMLYEERKELLSLYNAMNHSDYTNPDDLEIVTLTNAVYIGMKNDKAFLLDCWLNMYEHQSTPNPNMPLRHLYYVVREYSRMVNMSLLYRNASVKLPNPRFVVFYNGMEKQPERQLLRLSDLYVYPEEEPMLELKVEFLNINAGYNQALKDRCESLRHYCIFVEKVRSYTAYTKNLNTAVEQAVKECIEEGVLKEFLIANRAEVIAMSILEFTFEDWEAIREEERKEARDEAHRIGLEEGRAEGREKGREEGREEGLKALVNALTPLLSDFEAIYEVVISNKEYTDCTKERVMKYYQKG